MGVTPWGKGEGEATKLMEREHNTVPIHKCKTKMVFQCINYTGKYKIKLKSSKSYVCDLGNIFFAFDFVAILYLTLRCQLKWIICTTKTKSRLSSPQVTSNLLLLLRFVVESWSKATGRRNVFPRLAMYGWLGYPVIFCWASWALICIQFHSCMCVTSNACEVNKPLATPSSFPKIWQWNS